METISYENYSERVWNGLWKPQLREIKANSLFKTCWFMKEDVYINKFVHSIIPLKIGHVFFSLQGKKVIWEKYITDRKKKNEIVPWQMVYDLYF